MAEEKRFSAEVHHRNGSVDWMMLIHGFGGSARTWKKQIDFFSRHYNLLVLEMHRGKFDGRLNLDMICDCINNTLEHYQRIYLFGVQQSETQAYQ